MIFPLDMYPFKKIKSYHSQSVLVSVPVFFLTRGEFLFLLKEQPALSCILVKLSRRRSW